MAEDAVFIVISDHHPRTGKRERLSQVRAHISKQRFQKLRQKTQPIQAEAQQLPRLSTGVASDGLSLISMKVSSPVVARFQEMFDCRSAFAAESTKRMHKFFDVHLHGRNSHPFFGDVVHWSVNEPHFFSTKLLNASAWDDVLVLGGLSSWTARQRLVSIKILSDTIIHDPAAINKQSTIAALQSLLGFELLVGDNQSICSLQNFYNSLLDRCDRLNGDWTFLMRGDYLLSCADRLRRAGIDHSDQHQNFAGQTRSCSYLRYESSSSVDFSWFTFDKPIANGDSQLISVLLSNVYQMLLIATRVHKIPLGVADHQYVDSQYSQLLPYVSGNGNTIIYPISTASPSTHDLDDTRPLSLRMAIFMLAFYVLSIGDTQREYHCRELEKVASRLRALLGSASTGSQAHSNWAAFPGALMWCHAIGTRFADPGRDRTWFLMQFLRTSHLGVLEKWEATSRSLDVIVDGLESLGNT